MIERPMYFGPEQNLLGILTSPGRPEPDAPAVILLNAGLLHRVGPNRLNVRLARHLAGTGITAFRFDISGIGDSGLGEGEVGIDRARRDTAAAMDEVHRVTGVDRFVLIGLCTGAFNAFRVALVDERVAGCVLIDGYGYPTARSRLRHYRSRILDPERWAGFVRRRLGREDGVGGPGGEDLVVYETEVVPKERFGAELASLIERDVALMMVYTEFGPLPVNYPGQLRDAFPQIELDRCVDVVWYPQTDHTFTLPGNRRRLVEDVETWLARLVPAHVATTRLAGEGGGA
jgi:pimeloyl-ACP methyl ester carboxylesterase